MCSHSLSKAHPAVVDVEDGVELAHEDLTQDPGARDPSKAGPAPRRRLRREEREQLHHLRVHKYWNREINLHKLLFEWCFFLLMNIWYHFIILQLMHFEGCSFVVL